MLAENSVIVLRSVRYRENSLIVSCYGRQSGRISLLVNQAFPKGKKSGRNVFFQPLSILDVVYYSRLNNEIQRVKEVSPAYFLATIHHNPVKLAIAVFLSELIYRSIREEEENSNLFSFLENAIVILDNLHSGLANFHLLFMIQLTRYLGFYPANEWNPTELFFDIKNGKFIGYEPAHGFYLNREISELLGKVMQLPLQYPEKLALNHKMRIALIDGLTQYYRFHLGVGINFRSLPVLMQLFE